MGGYGFPLDVIKAVKIRPGIYNKDKLIPPRREHRQKLWLEVAESVTQKEEWESYTEEEREIRVSEVSSKWKNLRDHFYREVKIIESGEDVKKRKYIYYDEMQFVRPYIGYKLPPVSKRIKTQDRTPDDTDIDMEDFLKLSDKVNRNTKKMTSQIKSSNSRSLLKTRRKNSYSTTRAKDHSSKEVIKNFNVLQKTNDENPRYKIRESDISFCLSLVPSLRELTGARKLRVKIDILKVLHKHLDEIEHNFRGSSLDLEYEEMEDHDDEVDFKADPLNNSSKRKKN